jgi:hypothetical protein
MVRSRPNAWSTSITTSDDDPDYQTDCTSVEGDDRNETQLQQDKRSDNGMSPTKSVRSAEYYMALAHEVNNADPEDFRVKSTKDQQNNVKEQWIA